MPYSVWFARSPISTPVATHMHTLSLTVLMTVYNGMPYLKESVRSLLRQDTSDFRLHIINNGSTDDTRAFLDEIAADRKGKLPEVTIEHLPDNIGRTAALNRALDAADTELAAVMDADDTAMPHRLSRQTAVFHKRPVVDLCVSGITYIDGNGTVLGTDACPVRHEELLETLVVKSPFARSAMAFRVAAARAAGGFDERFPYSQDLTLWIAMLARGSRAMGIPESLACIRVHPGRRSGQLALLKVRARDAYRLAGAMLGIPELARAARQAAMVRRARALAALNHPRKAVEEMWRAFAEAPFLLPVNPLVWRRARLERLRRKGLSFR